MGSFFLIEEGGSELAILACLYLSCQSLLNMSIS